MEQSKNSGVYEAGRRESKDFQTTQTQQPVTADPGQQTDAFRTYHLSQTHKSRNSISLAVCYFFKNAKMNCEFYM